MGVSLANKAVMGGLWAVGSSLGGRAIGLVGTLILTRYLAPQEYGVVSLGAVVVGTVNALSTIGVGQYVVANPRAGREVVFQATLAHVVTGLLALGALLAVAGSLAPLLGVPDLTQYVPGLVAAMVLDRISYMPSRILARDLRFNVLGLRTLCGESAYGVVAVWLAWAGRGPYAVLWAVIARSIVSAVIAFGAARRAEWLAVVRPDWRILRPLLGFGLPLSVAHSLQWLATRADNLLVAGMFGPSVVGQYNVAYNLADIPATQIGEHIGDVLLPSFAQLRDEGARRHALVRASGLLALVVFPLAVGLGAIAHSLVAAIFDARWAGVAPMLVVLCVLSVFRPIGWLAQSYLQAALRTRALMLLELLKSVSVLGLVAALGQRGVLWACAGVGMGFGANAVASLWVIHRHSGLSYRALAAPYLRPVAACIPMVAAVMAVRAALATSLGGWWLVVLELGAGMVGYLAGAFGVAGKQAHEAMRLLRGALGRRAPSVQPG